MRNACQFLKNRNTVCAVEPVGPVRVTAEKTRSTLIFLIIQWLIFEKNLDSGKATLLLSTP